MNKKDYLIIILAILASPTVFNLGKLLGKLIRSLF
jgi:hypothetical protein